MAAPSAPALAALQEAVEQHIREADAEFGVFVRHLPSGAAVTTNPDRLYLMASVFKILILLEALAQVDEGHCRLDERIELRADDQLPYSMALGDLEPGLRPTLRDLLTVMISVSDNTATDMVLRRIGIERVARRLSRWDMESTSLRRNVGDMLDLASSWDDGSVSMVKAYRHALVRGPIVDPFSGAVDPGFFAITERGDNPNAVSAQRSRENNVTSPRDIASLLERLATGELLSKGSTGVALSILLAQKLKARLPRYLPPQVPLGHKNGTFYFSRNDVGILYLQGEERIVLATFAVLRKERVEADCLESVPYVDGVDAAMGKIARSAYDTFAGRQKPC
jgi:beta-lactamase class A